MPPPPAGLQPSKDQSQPPPQGYVTPPHEKCHPPHVVYGDGGSSEVHWPLGPNL